MKKSFKNLRKFKKLLDMLNVYLQTNAGTCTADLGLTYWLVDIKKQQQMNESSTNVAYRK